MIRLLWVRKMADAGIALDDIRDAFATGMASAGADSGDGVAGILTRLDATYLGSRRNCGGNGPPCSGWSETGDVSEPKPTLDAPKPLQQRQTEGFDPCFRRSKT